MLLETPVKACKYCCQVKPITEYSYHPTCSFKRKNVCKPCSNAYDHKNYRRKQDALGKAPQVLLGGFVKVCNFHKGDIRADGMVFSSKRKVPGGFSEWWMPMEKFKEREARASARIRWRYHNDPVYREKERQTNSSERQKAAKRKWNRANGLYISLFQHERRTKIKGTWVKLTSEERERVKDFYRFRNILNAVHGKKMFEVDHMQPVSRGGTHHPSNLRVTTAVFNHRKIVNQIDPATFRAA